MADVVGPKSSNELDTVEGALFKMG